MAPVFSFHFYAHPSLDESSHCNSWLHIRRAERDLAADDEIHRRHPSHQRNGLDQDKPHRRLDESYLILQLVGLVQTFRLPMQALELLKRSVQSLLLRLRLEYLMRLQHPPPLPYLLSTPHHHHHLLLFHLCLVILLSLFCHPIHHLLHLLQLFHPFLKGSIGGNPTTFTSISSLARRKGERSKAMHPNVQSQGSQQPHP